MSIAESAVQKNNLKRVVRVVLEIGQFSGVEPELLRFAFKVIKKGTVLEQAEIEIEVPPLLLYCNECETEYLGEIDQLRCPGCLKERFKVIRGREMMVKSIVRRIKMSEKIEPRRLPGEISSLDEEAARDLRVITLERSVLEDNDRIAAQNRALFARHGIYVLNLISSPGAGKTSLLVETLYRMRGKLRCAVVEGDQQTAHDAQRIAGTGAPVVQINTRGGCHLNAAQVRSALEHLPLDELELIFIENVGNLVCPSSFDLGENEKIVLMSITEGEDKPVKYPQAFALARLMVLTKIDLLPHLRFDMELCESFACRVNPQIEIIKTSVFNDSGLDSWLDAMRKRAGR